MRRVEALVGTDAYDFLAREHAIVGQLTEALQGAARGAARADRQHPRPAQGRRARDRRDAPAAGARPAGALVSGARDVFGVSFVGHDAGTGVAADDLRGLALDVRGRLGNDRPSVVAVAGVAKDRPVVIVATNEAARAVGRPGR